MSTQRHVFSDWQAIHQLARSVGGEDGTAQDAADCCRRAISDPAALNVTNCIKAENLDRPSADEKKP
jgi:hypothetical protein